MELDIHGRNQSQESQHATADSHPVVLIPPCSLIFIPPARNLSGISWYFPYALCFPWEALCKESPDLPVGTIPLESSTTVSNFLLLICFLLPVERDHSDS